MRARLAGLGLAATLMLAMPVAIAQQAPKSQDEGIVVTGQREVPKEVARQYVRQVTSSFEGQLMRFREPVCPEVTGLADSYGAIVVRRIRKVAAEAGAPVAGEKCRTNLRLIVATDADALVDLMHRKTPATFYGVNDFDRSRALRNGSVHAWSATELLNEDGRRQMGSTMTVKSASIIELPTQRAIVASTVVIDDDAMLGKTLTQVADYAAMRALARARPPREGGQAGTILTLFDPNAVPPSRMTPVDQAYLRGLYDGRPTAHAVNAMRRIARRIARSAGEQDAAKN